MEVKMKLLLTRLGAFAAVVAIIGSSSSCMTTYDANGRPYQSVDPGLAIAGIAAAGLIGYAAGNNHGGHHHSYYDGGYYGGGGYYSGGYYRGRGYSHGGYVRSR